MAGRNKKESLMDDDTKNRLADYFTAAQLIEYLEGVGLVDVDTILDVFEEEVKDELDELEELMEVRRGQ